MCILNWFRIKVTTLDKRHLADILPIQKVLSMKTRRIKVCSSTLSLNRVMSNIGTRLSRMMTPLGMITLSAKTKSLILD